MSRLAIRLGVGWGKERKQEKFQEVGGRFKREGIYVYLWLIHGAIWQNPAQHCKAITLQLKINFFKKNKARSEQVTLNKKKKMIPRWEIDGISH